MKQVSITLKPKSITLSIPPALALACNWAWAYLLMFGTQRLFSGDSLLLNEASRLGFVISNFAGVCSAPFVAARFMHRAFASPRKRPFVALGAICAALTLLITVEGAVGPFVLPTAAAWVIGAATGFGSGFFLTCLAMLHSRRGPAAAICDTAVAFAAAIVVYTAARCVGSPWVLCAVATTAIATEGVATAWAAAAEVAPDNRAQFENPGETGAQTPAGNTVLPGNRLAQMLALLLIMGYVLSSLRELALSDLGNVTVTSDLVLLLVFGLLSLVALVLPTLRTSSSRGSDAPHVTLGLLGFSVIFLFFQTGQPSPMHTLLYSVQYVLFETFCWSTLTQCVRAAGSLGAYASAGLVTALFVGQDALPFSNGFIANLAGSLQLDAVAQPVVLMFLLLVLVVMFARGFGPAEDERSVRLAFQVTEDELYARRVDALAETFSLTEREREVIALLNRGAKLSAVGQKMHVSENTVKTHVRSVYRKTGVHYREELYDLMESLVPVDE